MSSPTMSTATPAPAQTVDPPLVIDENPPFFPGDVVRIKPDYVEIVKQYDYALSGQRRRAARAGTLFLCTRRPIIGLARLQVELAGVKMILPNGSSVSPEHIVKAKINTWHIRVASVESNYTFEFTSPYTEVVRNAVLNNCCIGLMDSASDDIQRRLHSPCNTCGQRPLQALSIPPQELETKPEPTPTATATPAATPTPAPTKATQASPSPSPQTVESGSSAN